MVHRHLKKEEETGHRTLGFVSYGVFYVCSRFHHNGAHTQHSTLQLKLSQQFFHAKIPVDMRCFRMMQTASIKRFEVLNQNDADDKNKEHTHKTPNLCD